MQETLVNKGTTEAEVPVVGAIEPDQPMLAEGEISEGEHHKDDEIMSDVASELETGPQRRSEGRQIDPVDFDMEEQAEDIELVSGPSNRSVVRTDMAPRTPAQTRPRHVTSPHSPDNETKRVRSTTGARQDVDDRDDAVPRVLDPDSPSTTADAPTDKKPRIDSLDAHFRNMDVGLDTIDKQVQSCMANGKWFDEK